MNSGEIIKRISGEMVLSGDDKIVSDLKNLGEAELTEVVEEVALLCATKYVRDSEHKACVVSKFLETVGEQYFDIFYKKFRREVDETVAQLEELLGELNCNRKLWISNISTSKAGGKGFINKLIKLRESKKKEEAE